jgi:hypothetical protein
VKPARTLAWSILLAAPPASAITKGQCVDANTNAQNRALDGRFSDAREQLEACSDPSCPAVVKEDCARRLKELDRVQPTLVFDVAGAEPEHVQVSVDGRPLFERVDGPPIRVDPGEHVFLLSAPGVASVTRSLLIKQGEKDRHERILLAPIGPIPAPATTTPPRTLEPVETMADSSPPKGGAPASAHPGIGTQKILGLGIGGLGVTGLVVGSVFGAMTFAAVSQQKSDCSSPACTNRGGAISEHGTAVSDGTISDVAFIGGAALVAFGATLYFTAPRFATSARALSVSRRLALSPYWTPAGPALLVRGEL